MAALAAAAAVEVPGTPAYILWSGPHPAAYELGKVVGWTQWVTKSGGGCLKAPVWERPLPYNYTWPPVCYEEGHGWRWNATWYISPVDKRAFWTAVPVAVKIKGSIAFVARPAAYWGPIYGEISRVSVHFVFERPGWVVRIRLLGNGTVVSDVSWGAVADMTFFTETPYIHYVFVLNSSAIRTGALSHRDVHCVRKEEVQPYEDADVWVRDKYGVYAVCWTHRFSPWDKTRPHGPRVLYVDQNGEILPAVKRRLAHPLYRAENLLKGYFNRSLSLGFDVVPDWAVEEIYAFYLAMQDAEKFGFDSWWLAETRCTYRNATVCSFRDGRQECRTVTYCDEPGLNKPIPVSPGSYYLKYAKAFAVYEPGARRLRIYNMTSAEPLVYERFNCYVPHPAGGVVAANATCLDALLKRMEEVAARYDPTKAGIYFVEHFECFTPSPFCGRVWRYVAIFENGTAVSFRRSGDVIMLNATAPIYEKVYNVSIRFSTPVSQYAGTVEVPVYVNVTRTVTATATETVTVTVTAAVTATKEVPVTATVTAVHTAVLTHTATVAVKEPDWTATALVALASAAAAAAAAYLLRRR